MASVIVVLGVGGVLFVVFAGLFVVLITGAYLIGKRFRDPINRVRIMIGALIVFFLAIMGFFGYLALVMSRTSTIHTSSQESCLTLPSDLRMDGPDPELSH